MEISTSLISLQHGMTVSSVNPPECVSTTALSEPGAVSPIVHSPFSGPQAHVDDGGKSKDTMQPTLQTECCPSAMERDDAAELHSYI